MLSNGDLERLITDKRREIEKEKIALGLSPPDVCLLQEAEDTENGRRAQKTVRIDSSVLSQHHANSQEEKKDNPVHAPEIPAELERYIRRYLGLPVMLKAGEYSPNNPLVRDVRQSGDVLLGLGEYERRRNTLRKIRQQQYREYLDQQAKKKQEAKEQAERERLEQEERERKREEETDRIRQQLERDREAEQRRASVCYVPTSNSNVAVGNNFRTKVDTGVQVGISRPLSVAVQTDDAELFRLSPSPTKSQLTQAERELSPRTVADNDDRPIHPATWKNHWEESEKRDRSNWVESEKRDRNNWEDSRKTGKYQWEESVKRDRNDFEERRTGKSPLEDRGSFRRRSYGDFNERSSSLMKKTCREKLISDLRHTYMPSIFDADAIQMRNVQAEKEAAERRQFYQQELKNQIQEQQRIREERKTREKMLEQAEMRRLEEQLRMLRVAQEREAGKQRDITAAIKENTSEYENKRKTLQKEIDYEHQKLIRATSQSKRHTNTALSDSTHKLPNFNYKEDKRLPYSTNIPDNSIFSPNYDVDSYLRKNLNPKKDTLVPNLEINTNKNFDNVIIEKAIVHERPKQKKYENFLRNLDDIQDDTPIPVLRHSPVISNNEEDSYDGMKLVESKWKVPAVQKNILKSIPNDQGKNVSILTQLGSIRRQLQLEQLRLDNVLPKSD